MLEAKNITKKYQNHTALDDVSVSVPRGSIYGLLGPNGAGKTTLIRIINGITAPDSGCVLIDGHQLTGKDTRAIGYLPEERGLYKKMKVGEQAVYFARLKGMSKHEAVKGIGTWFGRFGISGWRDMKVSELSKGMAQKVQFIISVLHSPRLLILDEPFSGFDPVNAALVRDEILRLRDSGTTVILSTHNMASVEEICDHITLINSSRNVLSGRVADIRRSFGDNIYRVDFTGDCDILLADMPSGYEVAREEAPLPTIHSLRIRIPAGMPSRDIISFINERVEIHNFAEVIPGMSDIFISVVNSNT